MYYYDPDIVHMWNQQCPCATREDPTQQRLFAMAPKPMRNGMDTGKDCRPTVACLTKNAQCCQTPDRHKPTCTANPLACRAATQRLPASALFSETEPGRLKGCDIFEDDKLFVGLLLHTRYNHTVRCALYNSHVEDKWTKTSDKKIAVGGRTEPAELQRNILRKCIADFN